MFICQVCFEVIYCSLDVVAVLTTGYVESQLYFNFGRWAVQIHPVVVVVSPLNAFNQIDAKTKNVSW